MAAQIELRIAAPRAGHAARVLREAAGAWVRPGEAFSLSLVTDREMRRLNRAWRGKDRPTDVLSWPAEEIVISLQTARRQAREGGWPLRTELRRLLAHGIAHCRGFDHDEDADARVMAAEEERLLGKRGLVGDSLSQGRGGVTAAGRLAPPVRAERRERRSAPEKRTASRLARRSLSR